MGSAAQQPRTPPQCSHFSNSFTQGGLGSKLLSNPELKPQLSSSTKFTDVMGVDEVGACGNIYGETGYVHAHVRPVTFIPHTSSHLPAPPQSSHLLQAKAELMEVVEYLRAPAKFTALGGKLPKVRVLLPPSAALVPSQTESLPQCAVIFSSPHRVCF